MKKVKVGVLGTGKISGAYFQGMKDWDILEVVACADLFRPAAEKAAAEHGVPQVLEVDELLAHPEIDIIVNLTVPQAHAPMNMRILEAGKHVYLEKPFSLNRAEGQKVIALARKQRLLIGCAPDTVVGAGHQACRLAVDTGKIGQVLSGTAFMVGRGPEHWHPNPDFYYQIGGGPLFDMGPYYLSALVAILGPVKKVTAVTTTGYPTRPILSEPKKGKIMTVETPTHLTGILEFASGAVVTTIFSFDVFGGHNLPMLELHGTLGSLSMPDPNGFGTPNLKKPEWSPKPPKFKLRDEKEWTELPITHTHRGERGMGVADLAYSVRRKKRPVRASGALAFHVVDIMCAYEESSKAGKAIKLKTSCERPPMVPVDLKPRLFDK